MLMNLFTILNYYLQYFFAQWKDSKKNGNLPPGLAKAREPQGKGSSAAAGAGAGGEGGPVGGAASDGASSQLNSKLGD